MAQPVSAAAPARGASELVRDVASRPALRRAGSVALAVALRLVVSFILIVAVERIARGSFTDVAAFMFSPLRPGFTTVAMVTLVMLALDAVLGRAYQSALIVVPLLLVPAFVSSQKQLFLSDPLYPTDFLFGRQIVELLPVMAADRPWTAAALGLGLVAFVIGIVFLWRACWRRLPRLQATSRVVRLLVCLPLITGFASIMDYATFSWLRDRLNVIPMMYDQKENYRHNGFIMAFAFNLPMANVSAPAGYSGSAMDAIPTPERAPLTVADATRDEPDVIMLMSESLWDPTRLTNVTFSEDPMPFMRSQLSGHAFSPEFGGMTANVEFEALTGFSNAFLPYGSIPYQQYIRHPIPSLATFFRGQGYAARAIHPYQSWFWNRGEVYKAFGFEEFKSEENLPALEKRGFFASDEALFKEIMREADGMDKPFFFFSVTLQGHGPYEPNRYKKNTIAIEAPGLPLADRQALATYTQGVKEADDSLKMLFDWASKRERETIVVVFGDHLPPLGSVYVNAGYMPQQVASRKAPLAVMKQEHETPLIVWSSKTGPVKDIGTISPALIPHQLVSLAGFDHPYYTGYLGDVRDRYSVIDRYQLVTAEGAPKPDWSAKGKPVDPLVANMRFLQYDMMFGKQHAGERFFPGHAALIGQGS